MLRLTFQPDPVLDELVRRSCVEFNDFFETGWTRNTPKLFVVPDRATINALRETETEDWIIGWAHGTFIFVLAREKFTSESSHPEPTDARYHALIRHELIHVFFQHVTGGYVPIWLNDGLCIALSGQLAEKPRPEKFTSFLDFHDSGGKGGLYDESGFAARLLIRHFGREKLLQLLRGIRDAGPGLSPEKFASLFTATYGVPLEYGTFDGLLGREGQL